MLEVGPSVPLPISSSNNNNNHLLRRLILNLIINYSMSQSWRPYPLSVSCLVSANQAAAGSSSLPQSSSGDTNTNNNNDSNSGCNSAAAEEAVRAAAPVVAPPQMVDGNDEYFPDLERLSGTVNKLEASGWYYGKLDWKEADILLRRKPVGTFILRDSSDCKFLFALSVRTERGPTSVRIDYVRCQFQLDSVERLSGRMPLFDCVVALVEYYVKLSGTPKAAAHVWMDDAGRRNPLPIRLVRPLYHTLSPLQHLCRRFINERVPPQRIQCLDLPKPIVTYLREYPYGR